MNFNDNKINYFELCKDVYNYFVENGIEKYLSKYHLFPSKMKRLIFIDTQMNEKIVGYFSFPNNLSPWSEILIDLTKKKFGDDFNIGEYMKTPDYLKFGIALSPFLDKNDKDKIKQVLIHEFWHYIEYMTFGKFDPISEGTAVFVENKYKEIDFDSLSKYEKFLYISSMEIVSKHMEGKKFNVLLEDRNMRKKMVGELIELFEKNFTKEEIAKIILDDLLLYTIRNPIKRVILSLASLPQEDKLLKALEMSNLDYVAKKLRNNAPKEFLDVFSSYFK